MATNAFAVIVSTTNEPNHIVPHKDIVVPNDVQYRLVFVFAFMIEVTVAISTS